MRRYADGDLIALGSIPVRLKVNRRARRILLRIDEARREATAIAPRESALARAVDFANDRRQWLEQRLAAVPAPPVLVADGEVCVLGRIWRLRPDGRRPRLVAGDGGNRVLAGCGAGEVDRQLVARAVRAAALPAFAEAAGRHCARLGESVPRLALADARGRWGSCTPAGPGRPASIRLSWRLALAPWSVADYVVAHECAHLRSRGHGPGFWDVVRDLAGDVTAQRTWLRARGAALHAF